MAMQMGTTSEEAKADVSTLCLGTNAVIISRKHCMVYVSVMQATSWIAHEVKSRNQMMQYLSVLDHVVLRYAQQC